MSEVYKFQVGYSPVHFCSKEELNRMFTNIDTYTVDGYDGLYMLICGNDNPDDTRAYFTTDDTSVLEAYAEAVNDEIYDYYEETV